MVQALAPSQYDASTALSQSVQIDIRAVAASYVRHIEAEVTRIHAAIGMARLEQFRAQIQLMTDNPETIMQNLLRSFTHISAVFSFMIFCLFLTVNKTPTTIKMLEQRHRSSSQAIRSSPRSSNPANISTPSAAGT